MLKLKKKKKCFSNTLVNLGKKMSPKSAAMELRPTSSCWEERATKVFERLIKLKHVKVKSLSRVHSVTPWTVAYQVPPSM